MKKIVRIGFVVACVVGMVPFYVGAQTPPQTSQMPPPEGMSLPWQRPVRRIVKPTHTAKSALAKAADCYLDISLLAVEKGYMDEVSEGINFAVDCMITALGKFSPEFFKLYNIDKQPTPIPPIVQPPFPPIVQPPIYPIYPPHQPSSGQKKHYWNLLNSENNELLMSWINSADENSARVKALDIACDGVKSNVNMNVSVWEDVGAGDPKSPNFGMPNKEKCLAAKAGTLSPNTPPYPYTYGGMNSGAGTCSDPKINDVLPGTYEKGMDGNDHICFGSGMNGPRYVRIPTGGAPIKDGSGAIKVFDCATTPIPMCSMNTSGTTGNYNYTPSYDSITDQTTCTVKGYYWGMGPGGYTKCFASQAMAQGMQSGGGGYVAPMSGTTYSATGSSMPAGGCPAGQFWTGSSCVINCSSTQYWNGTACANNVTNSPTTGTVSPTANIFDAFRVIRYWFSRP